MSEKIVFASDHGGFNLKNEIMNYVKSLGYEVIDVGTFDESSVDYPDFAFKAVDYILNKKADRGIIMCGTGIGISITANKFPGIRAALCHDAYTAKMSRLHNDSNILAMGGRVIGVEVAKDIAEIWLKTEFEGGRHERRINKIEVLAGEFWQKYMGESK